MTITYSVETTDDDGHTLTCDPVPHAPRYAAVAIQAGKLAANLQTSGRVYVRFDKPNGTSGYLNSDGDHDLTGYAYAPNAYKFVVYQRDAGGRVERLHTQVNLPACESADYKHAETLMGWAESVVYWTADVGPATGIAPVTSYGQAYMSGRAA